MTREVVVLDIEKRETYVATYERTEDFEYDLCQNTPALHFSAVFSDHRRAVREAQRIAALNSTATALWSYNSKRDKIREVSNEHSEA